MGKYDQWMPSILCYTLGISAVLMMFLPDMLVNYTWIIPGPDYGLETVREILIPNVVKQFAFALPPYSIILSAAIINTVFYLGWELQPERQKKPKKERLTCPKCNRDFPMTVLFENTTCIYCGHTFLTCFPNCDYEDKDGYYCPGFCPYAPAEDDGVSEYDFE